MTDNKVAHFETFKERRTRDKNRKRQAVLLKPLLPALVRAFERLAALQEELDQYSLHCELGRKNTPTRALQHIQGELSSQASQLMILIHRAEAQEISRRVIAEELADYGIPRIDVLKIKSRG